MYRSTILPRVRKQRLLHDATLELTYNCNLDCFYCYNDREKEGIPLSLEQYAALLTDLASMQTMFLMLTGGEPMIHPHFFDIGRIARDLGFVVRIRTNGHSLVPAMARRLRDEVDPYVVEVSLHGATASVHDKQTRVPGSFDRLVKNITTTLETGLQCRVVTTPTAWNEHQIEEMFTLCDRLGVVLRFQGPVGPRDNGDTTPLIIQPRRETWDKVEELLSERRRKKMRNGTVREDFGSMAAEIDYEEPATCSVGVAGVDIDPYGNVRACMHLDENAGNLHHNSIEQIWRESPLFQRAREKSIDAALQFKESTPRQFGAPTYCIAVEENTNKGCGQCARACDA